MVLSHTVFSLALVACIALSTVCAHPLWKSVDRINERRMERNLEAANTCFKYTCVNAGQSCAITVDTTPFVYPYCIHNTTCNNNTCAANPPLGTLDASCDSSDSTPQCYAECINDKCNQAFPPGAKCKNDNQCAYFGPNGLAVASCLNKQCAGISAGSACSQRNNYCSPPLTCGPDGTCIAPLGSGANCTDDSHCDIAFNCINHICSTPLASGAACNFSLSDDVTECGGDTMCTPTDVLGNSAKCVQVFSQGNGAFCTDFPHCAEGFFCNEDNSQVGIGTCQSIALSSSFKSCDISSNTSGASCNAYESCNCNYNKGQGACILYEQGTPSGLKNAYHNAEACLHKCARTDMPCIASHCRKQICKYQNLYIDAAVNNLKKAYPSCLWDELSSTYLELDESFYGFFTCDGAFVQYSLVLALMALFSLLL